MVGILQPVRRWRPNRTFGPVGVMLPLPHRALLPVGWRGRPFAGRVFAGQGRTSSLSPPSLPLIFLTAGAAGDGFTVSAKGDAYRANTPAA